MAAILFVLCACLSSRAEVVRVSAAISLKTPLVDVARAYKEQGGDAVEFNFAASGQLAAQVRKGAPVDLFISAAEAQMEGLGRRQLLVDGTRCVVAGNRLVLIVPAGTKDPIASFEDLRAARVTRIAVGDPRTVPAGMYAKQVLAALKLQEAVEEKLVYASSVRQALLYAQRGEVAAALVYATDAREAGEKVKVVATAKAEWHAPIVYPAAVIKASDRQAAANRFLEYLRGAEGRRILVEHGFIEPPKQDDP